MHGKCNKRGADISVSHTKFALLLKGFMVNKEIPILKIVLLLISVSVCMSQ